MSSVDATRKMDLSSFSHSCIYAGNTCTQKLAEGEVEVPVEEGAEINYITRLDTIEAGADFNPDTAKEATVDISQVKEKGGKK